MKKKILVVDDSLPVRSLQSYILKSVGYKTETASNGIEALEKIYSGDYALVVADVNMPKMDGLTLIKTLRSQEQYNDLPIIIVTTEGEADSRAKGIEAGANIYMVKPTDPESLVQNVKMLLGE